jgi:hypothetical protein
MVLGFVQLVDNMVLTRRLYRVSMKQWFRTDRWKNPSRGLTFPIMSRPTEEQAKQLIERILSVLEEWDDVRYVIAPTVLGASRPVATLFSEWLLLEEAIEQCLEHDPEVDN